MRVARSVRDVGIAAALAAALVGCPNPQTCGARGEGTSLSGVVSYAIGSGAGSTLAQTVVVYDYSESCTYDDEEFPLALGSCQLWVSLDQGPEPPVRYFPGNPSAWASIEAGQVCDLALATGTATITVDSGTVAFDDSTSEILLSGTVVAWRKGGGPTGSIEWQLDASGWPP